MLLKAGTRGSLLRSYNITQTRRRQSWKGTKFKKMRLCADVHARSMHAIWFLTTWVTVENSSKCVFVPISMPGRVKNRRYSSCSLKNRVKGQAPPPFRQEISKIATIMADINGSVNSKNCPKNLPYPQINKSYFRLFVKDLLKKKYHKVI